jgi:DNA-binding MarR family transcriptional regulator
LDKTEHLQAIMSAGRRIHEAVDTIDAIISNRLGVHRNDLRCLNILKSGPATPGEIAVRTRLTSGAVTALVDRLACAGFVERRPSRCDRRSVELVLTEARQEQMQAIQAEIELAIRDYFTGQDTTVVAEAGRSLGTLAAALERYMARHSTTSG